MNSRSLSLLDRQVFRLHMFCRHFWLNGFGDGFDRQIQGVRDHGDGLRQAHVLDHAGFHLLVKLLDGHARADFLLQRQPALGSVHDAQRLGVLDALGYRSQRHHQLVHDKTGIHAGTHQRHAPFLGGGIQLRSKIRIGAKRIRQFFASRNHAGLRFETSHQLIDHLWQRGRRGVDHYVRV